MKLTLPKVNDIWINCGNSLMYIRSFINDKMQFHWGTGNYELYECNLSLNYYANYLLGSKWRKYK